MEWHVTLQRCRKPPCRWSDKTSGHTSDLSDPREKLCCHLVIQTKMGATVKIQTKWFHLQPIASSMGRTVYLTTNFP